MNTRKKHIRTGTQILERKVRYKSSPIFETTSGASVNARLDS
jgi:hypothetical protein